MIELLLVCFCVCCLMVAIGDDQQENEVLGSEKDSEFFKIFSGFNQRKFYDTLCSL